MVGAILRSSSMKLCLKSLTVVCLGWLAGAAALAAETDIKGLPAGWTALAPRDEIKPIFRYEAKGGRQAREAIVELHYRWGNGGQISWSDISLAPVVYQPRIVRLAAIHYRPESGRTPAEKREQFAPLIAKAAEQKADLVVLPETLTYYK